MIRRLTHLRFRRPSQSAIFTILMLAAVVMLLLPYDLFHPLRQVTALTALPQLAVQSATRQTVRSVNTLAGRQVPADAYAESERRRKVLENEVSSLRLTVHQLRGVNEQLTRCPAVQLHLDV